MPDKERGLYGKFRVERIDGSSEPGGKHESCEYFVLDLDHDPFALFALRAYMNAAREGGFELLADDLSRKLAEKAGRELPKPDV